VQLVTYQHEGQARTGVQLEGKIVDLNRAYRAFLSRKGDEDELAVADGRVPVDMISLLNGGDASLAAAREAVAFARELGPEVRDQGIIYAVDEVTLLAPVLRPAKVICVGLNYRAHAEESGATVPDYPALFHKVVTSVIGPGQAVLIPYRSEKLDYEVELAVVIGKRGKHIKEAEALSYAAGYTCANDISARDLQSRTSQWTTGKMMDASCPLGPVLVTRDEVPDPNALSIKTLLNGEVMQASNTADMIFSVPYIISYISEIITLEPGDVILTGTPEGIGDRRTPPVYLKAGDTVSVTIEKLGTLTNPVENET
jgi:acylpyruvate hydrolase